MILLRLNHRSTLKPLRLCDYQKDGLICIDVKIFEDIFLQRSFNKNSISESGFKFLNPLLFLSYFHVFSS